jgi:hypothetical protein
VFQRFVHGAAGGVAARHQRQAQFLAQPIVDARGAYFTGPGEASSNMA